MCFAPQLRALFRHLNFQKWSEPGLFCTFWLGNVLRATTACNFSSLIWPAGSAPAALLFDPPEPQIIGKTQCFATFSVSRRSYLFAHLHLLSSDLFSSDSSHLCFSTVHMVGSFTSKLPSITSLILNFWRVFQIPSSDPHFLRPEMGMATWPVCGPDCMRKMGMFPRPALCFSMLFPRALPCKISQSTMNIYILYIYIYYIYIQLYILYIYACIYPHWNFPYWMVGLKAHVRPPFRVTCHCRKSLSLGQPFCSMY